MWKAALSYQNTKCALIRSVYTVSFASDEQQKIYSFLSFMVKETTGQIEIEATIIS